jgi:hypothetical protein
MFAGVHNGGVMNYLIPGYFIIAVPVLIYALLPDLVQLIILSR